MAAANHHYVTRAYLNGFLADEDKRLRVYTRDGVRPFRAQPDKVARIRNYYTQVSKDGTVDDTLEHALQRVVEDPGIEVIRKLNAGNYDISRDERDRLALLLAIQEYRVPWMRDHMESMVQVMQTKFAEHILATPGLMERTIEEVHKDKPANERVTAESIREAFRSGEVRVAKHPTASLWAMGSVVERLNDMYYGMHWTVRESEDVPLITSDCPVHKYYHPIATHIPYRGIMDSRVEVRFPISRARMLVLTPDFRRLREIGDLQEQGRAQEAQERAMNTSPIRSCSVDAKTAFAINAHTISMASRIVIASREMPEIPTLFRGPCQNVRFEIHELPDGILKMDSIYGTPKA